MLGLDLKLFDSLGSGGAPELVLGLRERGTPSDGAFNARTGLGYVAPKKGDYARAIDVHGVDVRPMLFETLGGFSPEVVELLRDLAEERQNKLNKGEYDQTTWAARTWTTFTVQKLSVALHRAAALEIALALGLSVATDQRA